MRGGGETFQRKEHKKGNLKGILSTRRASSRELYLPEPASG